MLILCFSLKASLDLRQSLCFFLFRCPCYVWICSQAGGSSVSGHIQLLFALPQAAQIHKLGWDVSVLGGFATLVSSRLHMRKWVTKNRLGLVASTMSRGMIRTSLAA